MVDEASKLLAFIDHLSFFALVLHRIWNMSDTIWCKSRRAALRKTRC